MKYSALITLIALAMFVFTPDTSAQIKINLKEKIKREANKRANKKADEKVQKGFDDLEKGLKGVAGKEGEDTVTTKQATQTQGVNQDASVKQNQEQGTTQQMTEKTPMLKWSKYDFVPGDKVIFEDNLEGEENGEFPSRWDLDAGTVENAVFGGENVIMFRGGNPKIVPYLKNPTIDYLPDVFTVEFDLYLPSNSFTIYFYDRKNQNSPSNSSYMSIWSQEMSLHPASSRLPNGETINKKWAHIAIAYTNGKMKAYINETRLINIPHLAFDPAGITLNVYHANDNNLSYIKNFRIAEGGVKYYDRFLQDGKIVSNGIRFDTGKATLKPESMGVINEIYKMLSEHSEINVSIEGHTDSDGDFDKNMQLSLNRAAAVRLRLNEMGIEAHRFSIQGFGESKPVDNNDTPEGKANNRRVEFVKK